MTGGGANYAAFATPPVAEIQPIQVESGYSGGTDPYAKYGGQAAYNTLKSGFDAQKANIYGSSMDAATSLQGVLSYLQQNDAIMAIERPVCLVQPAGKSLPEYLRNFVAGAKIG
jgi:hypothetical protein